jgi:PNKP adenylyltransferase domain, C-terminal region
MDNVNGYFAFAWSVRSRSLALREFALDIEYLERFGKMEPQRGGHECGLGVRRWTASLWIPGCERRIPICLAFLT